MKTLKLAKSIIMALILGLIFSFSFNPADVAAQNKDKNPPTQQTTTPKTKKHKKHRKHHKKHKKTPKTEENKTKENKDQNKQK